MSERSSRRQARLTKVFYDVCDGKKSIGTVHEAGLFLESLRSHPSPIKCVEKLLSADLGLQKMRFAITVSLEQHFITSSVIPFLTFIDEPNLKVLADGKLLEKIILEFLDPPNFWLSLLDLFFQDSLDVQGLAALGWLTLEALSLSKSMEHDFTKDAQSIIDKGTLEKCNSNKVRNFHTRIKHRLTLSTAVASMSRFTPGGRHDNDFVDFRQIQIFPTPDEFLSTEKPFYRTAQEISDVDIEQRFAFHIDNQFRLLREDMIHELREACWMTMGKKKRAFSYQFLGKLRIRDVWVSKTRRYFKKCSIAVESGSGAIAKLPSGKKRVDFLKRSSWFLKHQSFGALFRGVDIIAFAYLDRDDEALKSDPPLIGLQFTDEKGLKRGLEALQFPDEQLRFVLLGASVFAYEPILRALQGIFELPLQRILLEPSKLFSKQVEDETNDFANTSLLKEAKKYRQLLEDGRKVISLGKKEVCLDRSQVNCLINFLENPISLTQGPPGKYYLVTFSFLSYEFNFMASSSLYLSANLGSAELKKIAPSVLGGPPNHNGLRPAEFSMANRVLFF